MRLIDADSFLKDIKGWQEDIQDNEYDANKFDFVFERIYEIFEEIPTAYDINKVVAELEKVKTINVDVGFGTVYKTVRKDVAIEIVKHGGASDDVCEWRLCDEEANVYDTSCRNPHILIEGTPKENNYEYCPYCGKKIKVVE